MNLRIDTGSRPRVKRVLRRMSLLSVAMLVAVAVGPVRVSAQAVDLPMVARIREEGLQHSQVMDLESYMTDVLGARLTLSDDMTRAQTWARETMAHIGLVNITVEPYMDFGVPWDNEYVSVHMLEPDYSPMVAYPLAHTSGSDGTQVAQAMIVDVQTTRDLEKYRGKLRGMVVLISLPVKIDMVAMTNGVPRRTDAELKALEETVIAPAHHSRRPLERRGRGVVRIAPYVAKHFGDAQHPTPENQRFSARITFPSTMPDCPASSFCRIVRPVRADIPTSTSTTRFRRTT